jgi:hypothetical protein
MNRHDSKYVLPASILERLVLENAVAADELLPSEDAVLREAVAQALVQLRRPLPIDDQYISDRITEIRLAMLEENLRVIYERKLNAEDLHRETAQDFSSLLKKELPNYTSFQTFSFAAGFTTFIGCTGSPLAWELTGLAGPATLVVVSSGMGVVMARGCLDTCTQVTLPLPEPSRGYLALLGLGVVPFAANYTLLGFLPALATALLGGLGVIGAMWVTAVFAHHHLTVRQENDLVKVKEQQTKLTSKQLEEAIKQHEGIDKAAIEERAALHERELLAERPEALGALVYAVLCADKKGES